jgi:hypothetical protein
MKTGLRIEWCKSRARAMRWAEEVILLQEEMRRVLAYLEWRAAWWLDRGSSMAAACAASSPYREGLVAYSTHQADIQRALIMRFEEMWRIVPTVIKSACAGDASEVSAPLSDPEE